MFAWLKNFFLKIINSIKPLFITVFDKATQEVIAALQDIAKVSIEKLVSIDTITNEQKRQQAFNEIKAYAVQKGLIVRDSIIFLTIELTLNALKNKEK